jgi:hypothetical protein
LIQDASLDVVQVQPSAVLTFTVVVPPFAAIVCDAGWT